jgi:hypothetical protein
MTLEVRASQFSTYLRCARAYHLGQEWQWDGPARVGNMELGTWTHHLIAQCIRNEMFGGVPDVDVLNQWAWEWLEQKSGVEGQQKADAISEKMPYAIRMCQIVMADLEDDGFWNKWDVVEVEKRRDLYIQKDLQTQWKVTGQPDLVVRNKHTEMLGIVDWKTVGSLRSALMPNDWQLMTYALLLEDAYPGDVYYGMHVRIKRIKDTKRAKAPFTEPEEIRFTGERLNAHAENLRGLLERIENDKLWLPSPTAQCKSMPCQFLDACSAMDGTDDHEYVLNQTHVRIHANHEEATPTHHA